MKNSNFIKNDKRRFSTPLTAYPTGEKCAPPTLKEKEESKKIIEQMIGSIMKRTKDGN